jgi:NAD(P)H-dependent FMN reductase
MTNNPLRIAIIVGSTREGRFGEVIARWFASLASERKDMALDLIDLAELALPAILSAGQPPSVAEFTRRIDAADAFVVITPEYNHSYPASLKQAIDFAYREWNAKPVAFVSYGGISGGLRAVEHLRGIFAELQATTIRDGVSLHGGSRLFGPDGLPKDPSGCNLAANKMLEALAWWAHTLRDGRNARPLAA